MSNSSSAEVRDHHSHGDYIGQARCFELFCGEYLLEPAILVNYCFLVLRLGIAIVILLLGLKMDKDFMRSITVTLFVPIAFGELFGWYVELVSYIYLFIDNPEEAKEFHLTYREWTNAFINVINDYIHYDFMILMVLLLHCCKMAYCKEDRITIFPITSICVLVQIAPSFLCILTFVDSAQQNQFAFLRVIAMIQRLFTIACFCSLTVQICLSFPLLFKVLPYNHGNSQDMQIRDARSRLAWTLAYLVVPYVSLIPSLIDAVIWIAIMIGADPARWNTLAIVMELVIFLVNFHRITWVVILTVTFLPPYRRAVPLLFCWCSFCPGVDVEPLPRKEQDMSNMYRFADA